MFFESSDTPLEKPHQRRLSRRRMREQLAALARLYRKHLTDNERALLKLVLEHDSSFVMIARVTQSNVSSVSRRYYRIAGKLQALARRRAPAGQTLDQRIRRAYYTHGQSQSKIASELDITRHRVRKALLMGT